MELNNIFAKYFIPSTDIGNENSHICSECGGRCCNNLGCHISPNDLKEITKESIISLIDESGCISIDYWEGNPETEEYDGNRCYYLRIKNENAKVIDAAFVQNSCSILTDKGCPLSFEYRPKGARDLIPAYGNIDCKDTYSKQQCCIDWMKHQSVMNEVYNYYAEKGEITFNLMSVLESVFGGI